MSINKKDIFNQCLENLDSISLIKQKYKYIEDNININDLARIRDLEIQNEDLLSKLVKEVEPRELLKDHRIGELNNGHVYIIGTRVNFAKIVYEFFKRGVKFPEDIIIPPEEVFNGASYLTGRISAEEFVKVRALTCGPLSFFDKVYKDIEEGVIFAEQDMTEFEHITRYIDYIEKNNIPKDPKCMQSLKTYANKYYGTNYSFEEYMDNEQKTAKPNISRSKTPRPKTPRPKPKHKKRDFSPINNPYKVKLRRKKH